MNIYTPGEMVRLELLAYPTPDSLHPVEEAWRELAKKLLQDVQEFEELVAKHHKHMSITYGCKACPEGYEKPRQFPKAFKPTV